MVTGKKAKTKNFMFNNMQREEVVVVEVEMSQY